jgi:hypothetical protein
VAGFSPSDAAVEGFRVIGARWRLVVGWGLFNLVTLVALCVVLFVLLFAVVPFAGSREAAGAWGGVVGALVIGLGTGLVQLVVVCGLYRVELRPSEPGFLHLRIGRDEMRVLGAALVLVAIAIPLLALETAVTAAAARVSIAAAVGVGLAGAVAAYAVLLRFALTPVIAFAERAVSLAESWRRTRGQTWSLLGMALLLLCLLLLAAVVVWLAIFLVTGLATGFQDFGLRGGEAFAAHPGRYLLRFGAEIVLAPVWLVLGQSPWVAVYRALRPAAPEFG